GGPNPILRNGCPGFYLRKYSSCKEHDVKCNLSSEQSYTPIH
uniref:Uncharacterized protein n=1 Tax=Amphimedon queenslandica TaxID=400682 RepID=A0A1X7SFD5_AMPQE